MRLATTITFCILIAALAACGFLAARSSKIRDQRVSYLLFALIPPVIGNLLIVWSTNPTVELLGCYIYYLGMDVAMTSLIEFTVEYCHIEQRFNRLHLFVVALLLIDIVQLLLNPVFGHAFSTRVIEVEGAPYLSLVPLAGQVYHRIVDYGLFLTSLGIFGYKTFTSPRIYVERYAVIFSVMIVAGAWQSFYIFSGTPIDQSMIGFGVFGLLIYFFAVHYKPVRLLDRMLVNVVSDMREAIFFFDLSGACVYANTSALRLLGVESLAGAQVNALIQNMFGELPLGQVGEWTMRCALATGDKGGNANERHFSLDYLPALDAKGKRVGSLLSIRDRSQEEAELRRKTYEATHDALTGLYNKDRLFQRIGHIVRSDRSTTYYVGALDVKDFKIINDIFGSEFGDFALVSIGDWLRRIAGERTVYGRITGDKFGFLVPKDLFDFERIEERLGNFQISDGTLETIVQLHVGLYEATERGIDVSVMFDRAFLAMATIKSSFQRHIAFYDDAMRADVLWSQSITAQLGEAIEQRQIVPYLQPMVNAQGRVVGAEALVRWHHPVEGFLPPGRFIPVLEQNGLVAEVDRYMWHCACEILADWKRRGINLFVSVNISPKDFYFMDVPQVIRDLVREFDVDPGRLRLEITETVMMSDLEKRLSILEELRRSGFIVEMDDFGSGYSSLNMLKDMPVDVLKIDMMFLYGTKDQNKGRTILQNIINLSGDLGIPSLTEGVETFEQFQMLAHMGCKLFQGYYFAKPMPLADFEAQYQLRG